MTRASNMRKIQLRTIRNSNERKPLSPCRKSFLLPYTLRHRSKSYTTLRKAPSAAYKDQTSQVLKQCNANKDKSNTEFIQELLKEFSGLQHSTAILNHISKKYRQHLMALHKQIKNSITTKPKVQLQAEEAAKRQLLISNLLKKDVLQEKHLQDLQEKKLFENKMKYRLRDARLQSAKMKQHSDEFQSEMKKKLQRMDCAEEKALENVFKDVLNKQKEQVNLLCQEVKETGESDARQHLTYLDALENLYQTQYSMISEALVSEKKESQERMQAEKQEMRIRRRNFEKELKKEIRFMQEVILDSGEDSRLREFRL